MGFLDKHPGGYIGYERIPSILNSSGIWSINSALWYKNAKLWGGPVVTTSLLTALDSYDPTSYPGSGTTWADIKGTYNASLLNGVTYSNGYFAFDGSDDYAQGTIPTTATTNVSVCAFVNITGGSNGGCIFKMGGNSGGFAFGIGTSTLEDTGTNLVMLFPAIRWIPTSGSLGSGWKMITITINSSGVPSGYINGTFIGSYSGTAMVAPTGTYNLGRCIGDEGTGRQFQGGIGTVLIYNKELSLEEIQQNYEALKGKYGL